ncbi:MAG: hypothetical protein R3B93_04350 [Bacteroidia bacterium]
MIKTSRRQARNYQVHEREKILEDYKKFAECICQKARPTSGAVDSSFIEAEGRGDHHV